MLEGNTARSGGSGPARTPVAPDAELVLACEDRTGVGIKGAGHRAAASSEAVLLRFFVRQPYLGDRLDLPAGWRAVKCCERLGDVLLVNPQRVEEVLQVRAVSRRAMRPNASRGARRRPGSHVAAVRRCAVMCRVPFRFMPGLPLPRLHHSRSSRNGQTTK